MGVKQYKMKALLGGKDATQLVIARKLGESVKVFLNGEELEVTLVHIGNNSVGLMFETAEKNLILRKELIADSSKA